MAEALERTCAATPDPEFVVAVGDCGACGGVFGENHASLDGVANVTPVDVTMQGFPPTPTALLQGILSAVRRRGRGWRSGWMVPECVDHDDGKDEET